MPFQQFGFPQVMRDLGLRLAEENLFGQVAPAVLRADFAAQLSQDANLAAAVNTEKARSEFIIAPVLLELRRRRPGAFGLFSGVELDGDAGRGLNGICDFVVTRSTRQHVLSTPILTIIEAKNDNPRTGLGQCIAAMVAAQLVNQANGDTVAVVSGVVTTGTLWKFLRLRGEDVTLDVIEYHIDDAAKIMGVLEQIVAHS